MPIDAVQRSIHIRRKKNEVVFKNIDRLWHLSSDAKSHQDILNGLHPWQGSISLKFENTLPWFLALFGLMQVFSLIIAPHNFWLQCNFALGFGMLFWAYLIYEQERSINDVIEYLEERVLTHKYHLHFQQQPQHISMPLNPRQFIGNLKRLFPVFERGSLRNDISRYASTTWLDGNEQEHQVLLFEYHYIDEIKTIDKNGNTVKLIEQHKNLWGAFVFDVSVQGLAISTSRRPFPSPYRHPWHSSDIRTNQRLKFYGTDPMQMAKQLSPGFVLRLSQFFQYREGDLIFHPQQRVLCYLGPHDIFNAPERKQNIQDISALRGHLRTFKLVELEKLQTDLIQFLK